MKLNLFSRIRQGKGGDTDAENDELERLRIADAIVQRQGDHYWIVSGGDRLEDLRPQTGATHASH